MHIHRDVHAGPALGLKLVEGPQTAATTLTPIRLEAAARNSCLIGARGDAEAIETWISARCADSGCARAGRPAHTARSYRREAQRFLMWLALERGDTLATATVEACTAYKIFLADPQPAAIWCGPRKAPIGSAQWRPFAGGLSARSIRQAMTILSSLYHFLQDMRYLTGNPWTGVAMPRGSEPCMDTGRSLCQWHSNNPHPW